VSASLDSVLAKLSELHHGGACWMLAAKTGLGFLDLLLLDMGSQS
jgi:hypothetical protein